MNGIEGSFKGDLVGLKFTPQGSPSPDAKTPEQLAAEEAAKKAQQQNNTGGGDNPPTKTDDELFAELQTAISTKYPDTKFDADGNLVKEDGTVVLTADKVETEFAEFIPTPQASPVQQLAEQLGIELKDAQGNPIDYGNTPEAVGKFVQDLIPMVQQQALEQLYAQIPNAREVLQHLASGQSLEAFKPKVDYSKLEIAKDNKEQHLQVVTERFMLQPNTTKEEAEAYAKAVIANGDSYAEAEKAKAALATYQSQKEAANLRLKQEAEDKQRRELTAYYNQLKTLVESPVIKTPSGQFSVKPEERQNFYNYITKPVNQRGETQADIDLSKASTEVQLLIQYAMFNKFDLAKITTERAATKQAEGLKKFIADRITGGEAPGKTTVDLSKINVTNLNKG